MLRGRDAEHEQQGREKHGSTDTGLEEVLIDHAHCEKKAAGVAMNLPFSYVDHTELARAMTEIVEEELEHFRMVLDLLAGKSACRKKCLTPSRQTG